MNHNEPNKPNTPNEPNKANTSNESNKPEKIHGVEYRQVSFDNGEVLFKKKSRLPAMGWNSWNAFGSGNTEELTRQMADALVELGLDKLGYKYVVLDDGCYKEERVNGKLSNEEAKFPSGFKALADYLHERGLKFGMYNDIGTNLCAGAAVGTCGHEEVDAVSYAEWGVDFLKVDNCYYPWDNATFSDRANAKYVFAPNIRGITVCGNGENISMSAVRDGVITGTLAQKRHDYVTFIGTFDGTGPEHTPIGEQSSELIFTVNVKQEGIYDLTVCYATGQEEGIGSWLQIGLEGGTDTLEGGTDTLIYDDFLPETGDALSFAESHIIKIGLKEGRNDIHLMNHRRQENTLHSYAALVEELRAASPEKEIILSLCEWGKTQPQNWGYKVGDSWRILNDITFQVGSEQDPGMARWEDDYTSSITSQYNKAVIMDCFAGLGKGWNDPDMLVVGMNGLTEEMNRTHMAMWCMMNAPLMLGLDLRRVRKGDFLYSVITNEALIRLNQDALGVQAKRIYSTLTKESPDKEYLRDLNRVDILAKPLADGSVALSFINLSQSIWEEECSVDVDDILTYIGDLMVDASSFALAKVYEVHNLWSGQIMDTSQKRFCVNGLNPCGNETWRITPKPALV